jgi:hypothetical protein
MRVFKDLIMPIKTMPLWSGGLSAKTAPESLTQVEISRELIKIKCPFVTLEEKVVDVIGYAGGEKRGKSPRNNSGRVDITIWHESYEPRFAIEVKKTSTPSGIASDVKRLRQLVNRCPKLQQGIMVVITGAINEETINHRFSTMAEENEIKLARISPFRIATNKSSRVIYVGAAVFTINSVNLM